MAYLETQWWLVELPDEWQAEQEEDAVVISDEDGVGELVITTLQKSAGEVSAEELQEYAAESAQAGGGAVDVTVSDAVGLFCSYNDAEAGEHVREWYLRFEELFLFITYCCDSENAGLDDSAIDEILATLCFANAETRGVSRH